MSHFDPTPETRTQFLHKKLDVVLTAVETLFRVGRKDIFFVTERKMTDRQHREDGDRTSLTYIRTAAAADARHAFYYLAVETLYRSKIQGRTVTRAEIGDYKPHPANVDLRTHVLRGWQKIRDRLADCEDPSRLYRKHRDSHRFRTALAAAMTTAEITRVHTLLDAAVATELAADRTLRNRLAAAPALMAEIEREFLEGRTGPSPIYAPYQEAA